jgi:hypothetical protein
MKRVTGIGDTFFKTKDPEKLKHLYPIHIESLAQKVMTT